MHSHCDEIPAAVHTPFLNVAPQRNLQSVASHSHVQLAPTQWLVSPGGQGGHAHSHWHVTGEHADPPAHTLPLQHAPPVELDPEPDAEALLLVLLDEATVVEPWVELTLETATLVGPVPPAPPVMPMVHGWPGWQMVCSSTHVWYSHV